MLAHHTRGALRNSTIAMVRNGLGDTQEVETETEDGLRRADSQGGGAYIEIEALLPVARTARGPLQSARVPEVQQTTAS
jgi:hypothetical protein